jgi:hypothetical protein
MFGCAAVVTVPAVVALVAVFAAPYKLPIKKFAVTAFPNVAFAAERFSVKLPYPAVFVPNDDTVTIFAPATLVVTFPLSVTNIWLVPLMTTLPGAATTPVRKDPFPIKKLAFAVLPKFVLPDTTRFVNVPTVVMLGWALVVSDPATVVNIPAVPPILPTLALPVTVNLPEVDMLPADKLPVAEIVLLDEIELLATNALAVTVPVKLALFDPDILLGKSIVSDCVVEFSNVVTEFPLAPLKPKLNVLVVNVTHAMLALITTFPVGEFTLTPKPGVRLTDSTA